MATFPIQTARQELGFTPSTAVRANIDVRGTGGGGAAVGQAIIAGAELVKRKFDMDDALSEDKAKQIRTLAENEIQLFRDNNADTSLWEPNAEQIFSRIEGETGSIKAHGPGKARISLATQNWISERRGTLQIQEIRQKKQDVLGVIINDLTDAVRSGDMIKITEADESFNRNAKAILSPGETRITKATAIKAGEKLRGEDAVSTVHAAMEAASGSGGNFEIAKELAKNPDIPEPQQTTLRNAINSSETRFKNQVSVLDLAIQGKALTDAAIKMTEDPDAFGQEDFDTLPLNDESRILLAEKVNERAEAINAGSPDPWVETNANRANAAAISKVLDGTREEVSKVSVSEIIGKLGIITPAQAIQLINKRVKRLDKTNVINTPAHQRAVGSLNRLRDARLKMDDVKDSIEEKNIVEGEFGRMQNELESFAESIEGDSDFDAKILKKQQFLAKPIIETVTLNWFERMFSPKEQGFFTAIGFNTEAEELIQEKFDILKDQKIWKTLNVAEKESIRKRFEQGATVQDILDLVNGQ